MAEIPATRASLLVRLRDSGDAAAWTEFIDLYGALVYNYARKQGLQDADAADLGQEVLRGVAAAVGRLEYDPRRGLFRNWLFTLVRRRLSDWRAAQRRGPCGSGDPATRHVLEQVQAPPVDHEAWEAEWQDRVFAWACAQVRRDVTDSTWKAFWRTAMDGHPTQSVAADLGLTAAAVYLARHRVLARLKELVRSAHESERLSENGSDPCFSRTASE
ncbi:MAG: sigma-70 family RNA polymerase sigma factor [Gemmataceae bacterium]|nr:sigma-70 family RNA polymerase sigma factor [Gemmataceae bacterium]